MKVVEDGFAGPNAAGLPQPQDSNEFAPLPGRPGVEATPPTAAETPKRWKVIVPIAAAVLAFLVAGYFYFHRAAKLTDKDTIVLADFINTTGDPVFDGTLRQGLAVQLEQSPFLSLISDERIRQVLKKMGQPGDTRLTAAIAGEICERIGSAAILDGSIASLGSQYVLGSSSQELPHRRGPRPGTSAGSEKGRRTRRPGPDCQSVSGIEWVSR